MILNSDHCKICDNKVMDFSRGTLCALTNDRPDFINKCSKIILKGKFEKQITEINIEHDTVLKSRTKEIGKGITNIITGFGVILISIITALFLSKIFYFLFIGTSFASFVPIVRGTGILNNYFTDSKIAKAKKEKLDKVAALYGYYYNINIEHIKDSLGDSSIKPD